eukprot:CAMPEP_0194749078 /NCGR_PEP_ID=MMETSP0323_2-20130528/3284_1 /TAXON_ID=2866 ORGANISM="Crypthecodinium cohnii, Strain Seligo" /NCGR_SAMPLE_ID=MMETSP0323_2 /ASSEMBLY_ACC=CAM_ASM_000346 /LENGTH=41 /DNA_ID= /DNA_START= /DNA_END= /DNA_ORIENTATION=
MSDESAGVAEGFLRTLPAPTPRPMFRQRMVCEPSKLVLMML